jgi:hypothetical protein
LTETIGSWRRNCFFRLVPSRCPWGHIGCKRQTTFERLTELGGLEWPVGRCNACVQLAATQRKGIWALKLPDFQSCGSRHEACVQELDICYWPFWPCGGLAMRATGVWGCTVFKISLLIPVIRGSQVEWWGRVITTSDLGRLGRVSV